MTDSAYLPQIIIGLGIILLIIELMILGGSTLILIFSGLALITTGALMLLGLVNDNLVTTLWLSSLLTLIYSIALWKPFKKLQNSNNSPSLKTDFAELEFVLENDVDKFSNDVLYPYSGIEWKIRSDEPISQGEKVRVVRSEVGVLWVEKI